LFSGTNPCQKEAGEKRADVKAKRYSIIEREKEKIRSLIAGQFLVDVERK